MKSQQLILLTGYLTISSLNNVSCDQTCCRGQYYLPFNNTALSFSDRHHVVFLHNAHTPSNGNTAHQLADAQITSTSFLLSYMALSRPERNSVDDVYSSVNKSSKSTKSRNEIKQRLFKLRQRNIQRLIKRTQFQLSVSPGSAEALVR